MNTINLRLTDIQHRVRSRLSAVKNCPETMVRHRKREKLQQSALLCKLFNKKVTLVYRHDDELHEVNACAYLVNEKHVVLKSGQILPLNCIEDIRIA